MKTAIKPAPGKGGAHSQLPDRSLSGEIEDVLRLIGYNNQRFDFVDDDDLLEAAIYERNALFARYRYLLKCARSQERECV